MSPGARKIMQMIDISALINFRNLHNNRYTMCVPFVFYYQ